MRPEERRVVALLLVDVLVLMAAYYVVKTVREPLILERGTIEGLSRAAAKPVAHLAQTALLVPVVWLYGVLGRRFSPRALVRAYTLYFVGALELFRLLADFEVPYLGFAFYVWFGTFGVAAVAQFWSVANELFDPAAGARLIPIVALGAALGAPLGSATAGWLAASGIEPFDLLHVAAGLLLVQLVVLERARHLGVAEPEREDAPLRPEPTRAATLTTLRHVLAQPYVRAIGALVLLLNVVNTLGEYVLDGALVDGAEAAFEAARAAGEAVDRDAFVARQITIFRGGFYTTVNLLTMVFQLIVARFVVRLGGLRAVLLVLPLVALGAYGLLALGAGLGAIRAVKIIENAVDYSAMNTGKAMAWLPTDTLTKYAGKQVVDTVFVRVGDALVLAVVLFGERFGVGHEFYATVNCGLLVLALLAVRAVLRRRPSGAAASSAP